MKKLLSISLLLAAISACVSEGDVEDSASDRAPAPTEAAAETAAHAEAAPGAASIAKPATKDAPRIVVGADGLVETLAVDEICCTRHYPPHCMDNGPIKP